MEQEVTIIDFQKVADDIRSLKDNPKAAVPFMAGVTIAGLMFMPDVLINTINQIKTNNIGLDNFETLCVFYARAEAFRNDAIDDTAAHAEQGIFPRGEGQEGWNEDEFNVAINLLGLTLNQ